MLDQQRAAGPHGPSTIVAQLLEEQIDGKPLSDSQLVSIVRNWTAGEWERLPRRLGSSSSSWPVDRTCWKCCTRPEVRQAAMDEMLRLEAPLIANRRRTTRSVTMRGRTIEADAPVTVLWAAAQRDPRVFGTPLSSGWTGTRTTIFCTAAVRTTAPARVCPGWNLVSCSTSCF